VDEVCLVDKEKKGCAVFFGGFDVLLFFRVEKKKGSLFFRQLTKVTKVTKVTQLTKVTKVTQLTKVLRQLSSLLPPSLVARKPTR